MLWFLIYVCLVDLFKVLKPTSFYFESFSHRGKEVRSFLVPRGRVLFGVCFLSKTLCPSVVQPFIFFGGVVGFFPPTKKHLREKKKLFSIIIY